MPPAEAFEGISAYANLHGNPAGRPYFSVDGVTPLTQDDWQRLRAKFYCPMGITNVWSVSQLSGEERKKNGTKAVHNNQKPLVLTERIIEMASDEGDVVWDPFGGLFTTAIACYRSNRLCYSSEIQKEMYETAVSYVKSFINQPQQLTVEGIATN